jgi:hypothetical protein
VALTVSLSRSLPLTCTGSSRVLSVSRLVSTVGHAHSF